MKITKFKTPDIAFLAWLTQLWLLAHMPNHPYMENDLPKCYYTWVNYFWLEANTSPVHCRLFNVKKLTCWIQGCL